MADKRYASEYIHFRFSPTKAEIVTALAEHQAQHYTVVDSVLVDTNQCWQSFGPMVGGIRPGYEYSMPVFYNRPIQSPEESVPAPGQSAPIPSSALQAEDADWLSGTSAHRPSASPGDSPQPPLPAATDAPPAY